MLRLIPVALMLLPVVLLAQDEEYYTEQHQRYYDHIHVPNIRTVVFEIKEVELSMPVIMLNGGEQLRLSFDDLEGEYRPYSFNLTHCDRNWQPTDLPRATYIRGMQDEMLTGYRYSFNTVQKYIHYSLLVPSSNMQITLSGNYVLTVFSDYDPEKVVITRRFRVYENLVNLRPELRMPLEVEKRQTHHQLGLSIDHSKYDINNPLRDLSVHIQQNYRWDNVITDVKPIFMRHGELTYDNMGGITFEGGNEYRWVDIRSLRYQPENVRNIWYDPDSAMNHVFLINDKPPKKNYYVTRGDMNGAFKIDVREGTNPDSDADYAMVHFTLDWPQEEANGSFYVFGGLSEWQPQQPFRMDYNRTIRAYEAEVYLKQGYYNYQYLFVPDGQTVGSVEPAEGSYFQAAQLYTFYVYHQGMGMRYDRLVGHGIIASRN